MNAEDRFYILSTKYLTDKLSTEELQELESIVVSDKNYQNNFKELVMLNSLIDEHYTSKKISEKDIEKQLNEVTHTIHQKTNKKKRSRFVSYVAVLFGVLLMALSISYFIRSSTYENNKTSLVIPDENIVLCNDNDETEKIFIKDGISKIEGLKVGHKTTYKNKLIASSDKKTNYTLKIPFGKKFYITLSDGTKVHLNSGSTITYPNTFKNTNKRVVQLNGEGYFEVVKNHRKPFIVKTNSLNVRVLGTKFNVSSYKEDTSNSVVLVEGSVAVNTYNNRSPQTLILSPQEKAIIKKTPEKTLDLSKSVISKNDMLTAISWKNRNLVFENETFLNISKKLERHFNVSIVSKNEKLNRIQFTGRFNKQDVFEILDAFRVHTPFIYKVENNSIVIEPKERNSKKSLFSRFFK